jgi:hypothetical protein
MDHDALYAAWQTREDFHAKHNQKSHGRKGGGSVGVSDEDFEGLVSGFKKSGSTFDKNPGQDLTLGAIYKAAGLNGKPTIVSTDELATMIQDGDGVMAVERGFISKGVRIARSYHEGSEHYAGVGVMGNGTYMSGIDRRNTKSADAIAAAAKAAGETSIAYSLKEPDYGSEPVLNTKTSTIVKGAIDYADITDYGALDTAFRDVNRHLRYKRQYPDDASMQTPWPTTAEMKNKMTRGGDQIPSDSFFEGIEKMKVQVEGSSDQNTAGKVVQDMGRFAALTGVKAYYAPNSRYLVMLDRSVLTIDNQLYTAGPDSTVIPKNLDGTT